MAEVDPVILDKIIELSSSAIVAIESVTRRIDTLEHSIEVVKYTIHGNGEPGLNEKVRDFQKEIINLRAELNNIHASFSLIKSLEEDIEIGDKSLGDLINNIDKRISRLEWVMKIIIAATSIAATSIIGLLVKAFWGLLFV